MKRKLKLKLIFTLASLGLALMAFALHGCGNGTAPTQVTIVSGSS